MLNNFDLYLFMCGKDLDVLFKNINDELVKVALWFQANKLSLNVIKTKYSIFHATGKKRNIPLVLPLLHINNLLIKRDTITKFLGILLDENLTWKSHISYITSKISKSIGIIYKSRNFLKKTILTQLYHSLIHSYLTYGNIAWGSSCKTNLMPLYRKQKHAIRVINFVDKYTHSRPFFLDMKILNVFEINIYKTLSFMFKCKNKTAPFIFQSIYRLKQTKYPTRFHNQVIEPPGRVTKSVKFSISHRSPYIWNKFMATKETIPESMSYKSFRKEIKTIVLSTADIFIYF